VESSPWPGVVVQLVEDAGRHVVDQGRKVLRGRGPADAAGEQRIALTVEIASPKM
jgi:hypothetical protein